MVVMTKGPDPSAVDRRRHGLALKALRTSLEITQNAAADSAGVSLQSWQNWEGGKAHFDRKRIERATAALGATVEAFHQQLARVPRDPPMPGDRRMGFGEEPGRAYQLPVGGVAYGGITRPNTYDEPAEAELIDFADFFAPGTRVVRLAGMSMFPWAEPGGFVTYNVRRPPRRGQGCVIEMADGSYAVKRFERMEDTQLFVVELWPTEREIVLDLADVRGVYAIGLRGD